jgi:hypothetical protein
MYNRLCDRPEHQDKEFYVCFWNLYLKSVSCINNSRFPDSRALAKILELQIEDFFFLQIPIVLE